MNNYYLYHEFYKFLLRFNIFIFIFPIYNNNLIYITIFLVTQIYNINILILSNAKNVSNKLIQEVDTVKNQFSKWNVQLWKVWEPLFWTDKKIEELGSSFPARYTWYGSWSTCRHGQRAPKVHGFMWTRIRVYSVVD